MQSSVYRFTRRTFPSGPISNTGITALSRSPPAVGVFALFGAGLVVSSVDVGDGAITVGAGAGIGAAAADESFPAELSVFWTVHAPRMRVAASSE
jgi:hypothetical protein